MMKGGGGGVENEEEMMKGGGGGVLENEEEMSDGASVSLDDLKKKMDDFAQEREWERYHSPRNLLLAMIGEVGELSEIFQWKGEVEKGLPDWKEEEKVHLGEELSDVLLYLVRLSHMCGVDLGKAALRKIALNAINYPAPAPPPPSPPTHIVINGGDDCGDSSVSAPASSSSSI